jgi:hypothetical protein
MKFLISVIDGASNSAGADEMQHIDAFNDMLRNNGHWIYACGIAGPDKALIIDNRNNAAVVTQASIYRPEEFQSGFWLIEADDEKTAQELAMQGSKACNRRVEIRPLLGN